MVSACSSVARVAGETEGVGGPAAGAGSGGSDAVGSPDGGAGAGPTPPTGGRPITLAFAGDVHFEGALATLPDRPRSTLGPMARSLRAADLAVVNLESPLTTSDVRAPKELEAVDNRYWFRSPPAALDVLDRSGVDVVSVANNHGGDYGVRGVRDTLRAASSHPVDVIGAGRDRTEAFAPHRATIKGVDVAVLAADSSFRESTAPVWGVSPGEGPGLASARVPFTGSLLAAVRRSAAVDDLVVVYLHWGEEGQACPSGDQVTLARQLTAAGADIVVGTHAHLPMGAGVLGDAYVSFGLGNFLWYNGARSESGVLELTVRGDEVVDDRWSPATIPELGGAPQPLEGRAAARAVEQWRGLRSCTPLDAGPGDRPDLPPYTSSVTMIGARLREDMIGTSHDPTTCPVRLGDLRRVSLSYVGFDGAPRTGVLVVHRDVAREVVEVFEALYDARFPIAQMRVVDAYEGDDNASMAANNTSAYNCRTVAGTTTYSDHAFGRAIDINPVQNPYVLSGGGVQPPSGRRFVAVDRSPGAATAPGVIGADGVVARAFARAGWSWGGDYTDPDFQHFSAS